MSLADFPTLVVEIALTTAPLNTSPSWTDVSQYVLHVHGVQIQRGRPSELSDFQPGSCTLTLSNRDRRFDPRHSAGPYFGNLLPGKRLRIRALRSAVYYPLFDGFIESWPQEYSDGNKDATVTLTCLDGLTVLAEMVQPDPVFKYTKTTIGSCALFLRSCDGETWFDESGNARHATRSELPTHAATSFGSTVIRFRSKSYSTKGSLSFPLYTAGGPVGNDLPPGVNGSASISSSLAAGLLSPSVAGGRFTLASALALGTTYSYAFWFTSTAPSVSGDPAQSSPILGGTDFGTSAFAWVSPVDNIAGVDQGAGMQIIVGGPSVSTLGSSIISPINDGKPHHVVYSATASAQALYIDGVLASSSASSPGTTTLSTIDLDQYSGAGPTLMSPPMSTTAVQDITVWTKALSAAEALGLYQRGLGQLSETSAARVSRLIADTDWPSAWVNNTTNPKGTCVDYTVAFQGTLDALSEVADTEQGRIFVDASGVLQLLGRYYQFEVTAGKTSQATFSDDGTGVPYRQIATDYSSREVQNDITVVATLGVSANVTDSTSITAYRRQPVTISTLLPGTTEATDMATGLVAIRKDAVTRLSAPLQVQPVRNTANWPTVLGLELGHRVTLKLTPMRNVGSQISAPMVIEGIEWDITVDDWHVGFDLAPVPLESGTVGWFTLDDATFGVLDNDRLGY